MSERAWRNDLEQLQPAAHMEVTATFRRIEQLGGDPSLHQRGDLWRCHAVRYGNTWGESSDPVKAAKLALEAWKRVTKGAGW